VYPGSFKEEFSSGFCCDILLVGHHNGDLRESVDNHKNTVIAMLSRRKARRVIHRDGFPRSTRGRKQSIEALLLDGRFGNGTSSVGLDVLPKILSKVQPIEILLQYCHGFLNTEMPSEPTVVHLQNHLGMLA
jgi:hypothetical protein